MDAQGLVFLSHNNVDKLAVDEIAHRLRAEGIEPWLDSWHLVPGEKWQPAVEKALTEARATVVFVGPSSIGPWQDEEMRVAIDRRVGDPAYRVVPVLLPGAKRGKRSAMPPFLANVTWVEFERSLDEASSFRRLIAGIKGEPPGPPLVENIVSETNPYRGLQIFDVADSGLFFGREVLTGWLVSDLRESLVTRGEVRLLAIVGASGSGKSSLARAGLLAKFQGGALEGSGCWRYATLKPGIDPLESLASASSEVLALPDAKSIVKFQDDLHDDARILHAQAAVAMHGTPPGARLVLLVDQFEEIFTLCTSKKHRRVFIDNLLHAAAVTDGPTVVVLTLRADFFGRCAPYERLAAVLSDHQQLVGPMRREELREAIERPAWQSGCEFEPGLVDMLLDDVKAEPGALPLLQHALLELWRQRDGRRLTHDAYKRIGRVQGALARRADEVYQSFTPHEQAVTRRILLRLTQPGEGTEDTRRRAPLDEMIHAPEERSIVERVVGKLVDERLLVTEGNSVDVAHEALLRGWPPLREWLDQDREGLRLHRRLTLAAQEWKLYGDPSSLYRGLKLDQALAWRDKNKNELNAEELDFLDKSDCLKRKQEKDFEAQRQRELDMARKLADAAEVRRALEFQRAQEYEAQALAERRKKKKAQWGSGGLLMVALLISYLPGGWNLLRRPFTQGDLVQDLEPNWVPIALEKVILKMGCIALDPACERERELPTHDVTLRPFALMAYEVTVGQFRRFRDATSAPIERWLRPSESLEVTQPDWKIEEYPVVNISWHDASAFCTFVGARLPTEAEWEYAAKGGKEDFIYPWGREWDPMRANSLDGGPRKLTPVGSYPQGNTLHGLMDMAGNVYEWTSTISRPYPYLMDEQRENPKLLEPRILRGGSYLDIHQNVRTSSRNIASYPATRSNNIGFRCARDVIAR